MTDRTPVLIGGGQYTYRGDPLAAPTPLDLLERASREAAASAGLGPGALRGLDHLAVVGFSIDSPGGLSQLPAPRLSDPPKSLAARLGADPRRRLYTHTGGNTPQELVNWAAGEIADGRADLVLLAGAEFLGSLMKRLRAEAPFPEGYGDGPGGPPPGAPSEGFGDPRPGVSPEEALHGLGYPVNTYPLFENALRARDGRSLPDHLTRLGALFAPFTEVAAANPFAWFPVARSAEELVRVSPANRMVSYPYPKYLNAIMEVDQSAAVLMASRERAAALGVAPERCVYLAGCADLCDLWRPLERQNFHSSPAIRLAGRRAFEMAGVTPDALDLMDLYSCFPVAVEIAAEELGIALDDPRGLTVTGGLPYAGGPGNNYAMHAVATLRSRLLERRGAGRPALGLVTANGWFLTKQSVGVYATEAPEAPFRREDPAGAQREINTLPHPEIVWAPEGPAVVETYTVRHDREGPRSGVIIGRDARDRRFVAHAAGGPEVLASLEAREGVGRRGRVKAGGPGRPNLFHFEGDAP